MQSPVAEAAKILKAGRLVAFPTETVYGLGADASNAEAVRRIFTAKGRPSTNPLIVHVASVAVARRYAADWPEAAERLAAAFWPGPLTLVVGKSPVIVEEVSAGLGTVGLRVPDHPLALELLTAFGGPVAAPSANRSTRVSPTTAQHVREELGDVVDLVLDGRPCRVGIESTVLDLSGGQFRILRPGAITAEMIQAITGVVVETLRVSTDVSRAASSPGQQDVHYAPRTPAYRFEPKKRCALNLENAGLIALGDTVRQHSAFCTLPRDPAVYAHHFYAALRHLDPLELRVIYVEMPPDEPQWAAVCDRIRRATRPFTGA